MNAEFLITSLVVVLVPGTGVIYTVSTGLFQGWRASIAAAVGCTCGIIPHMLVAILGLSAILHFSALVFTVIKYAGAAYLIYLAWSMWRETGRLQFHAAGKKQHLRHIAIKGILVNILNPKLSIFFLAFLPLFISSKASSPLGQMLVLSVVFMAMTLFIFILYGMFAHGVRTYVVNSPRVVAYLQRSFAVIFALLGLKLAMANQ